jgi:hypothetical protein
MRQNEKIDSLPSVRFFQRLASLCVMATWVEPGDGTRRDSVAVVHLLELCLFMASTLEYRLET